MTPGSLFPDDDWADLRSELGLESATPTPTPLPTPEPVVADSEPILEMVEEETQIEIVESDDVGGEELEGDEPGTDEAETGEPTADGEPKKKRRRRRRRGRKHEEGETDESTEGGEDAEEPAAEVDEDSPEVISRQLVENLDVPSWGDIVAGLYRPGR